MLSFRNDIGYIHWDFAKVVGEDNLYTYYKSDEDCDTRWDDGHSRFAYSCSDNNIQVPTDFEWERAEKIIIIHIFAVDDCERGKGNGTKLMEDFLSVYGDKYDIFLEAGILSSEDKDAITEDREREIDIFNRICKFYTKHEFLEIYREKSKWLQYPWMALMMHRKGDINGRCILGFNKR
jgi:GNAT superfamily N-acetyltransferase